MEQTLPLLVGYVNLAVAGINLAIAIINAHNRKNPPSVDSKKDSKHQ